MSDLPWTKKGVVQTTKVFTPNMSDTLSMRMIINKEAALPMVGKIEKENTLFKQEIKVLARQISNLQSLSKKVLEENKKLRSHYYERNADVQKLLKTIQINMEAEIGDLTHQIHLLKEGNCLIFKKIQVENQKEKQQQQRIESLCKRNQQLQLEMLESEKVMNTLQLKKMSKLNGKILNEYERKIQRLNDEQAKLLKEVDDLTIKTNNMRNKLKLNTRLTKKERVDNQNDEESLKNNIFQTVRSIKELTKHVEVEVAVQQKQRQIEMQLRERMDRLQRVREEKYRQKERKSSNVIQLKHLKETLLQNILNSKQTNSRLEIEVMKIKQKKEEYVKNLESKKREGEDSARKFEQDRSLLRGRGLETKKQIKQKIEETEVKYRQEMADIEKEKDLMESTLSQLNEQLQQLNRDYQFFKNQSQNMVNPIEQIQKIQFKMSMQEKKKVR